MSKARDLANAGTALTTVSATELGYLDGVTSAVQTQIDSKIGQSTAINPTIVDAKGDIIAATAADTVARLAVGANNTILTADSTTATGLKWGSAPTGGITSWTLLNTGGTFMSGSQNITISGISAKQILVLVGAASADAYSTISVRPNNDSAANYIIYGISNYIDSTYAPGNFEARTQYSTMDRIPIAQAPALASASVTGSIFIDSADSTGWKRFICNGTGGGANSTGGQTQQITQGLWEGTTAITSITINSSSGNFDNGTVYVLGGN
jgi:hypothetical protein